MENFDWAVLFLRVVLLVNTFLILFILKELQKIEIKLRILNLKYDELVLTVMDIKHANSAHDWSRSNIDDTNLGENDRQDGRRDCGDKN